MVLALATPAAAELTRDQQACVNALNKRFRGLTAALGKDVGACIKDHGKGVVADLAACAEADRKGKVAKAVTKIQADFERRCAGTDGAGVPALPPVFAASPGALAHAGRTKERRMLAAIYGPDVAAVALTEAADEAGAACQAAVAKTLLKCQDVTVKEFVRCAKAALAAGKDPVPAGATTPAELATCVLADASGKIARACDLSTPLSSGQLKVDKVRRALASKCVAKGVDLAAAFPQCGSADPEDVHGCLEGPVACAACLALDAAGGLEADCDALDDGQVNQSCLRPLELLVPAYANPCCDDGPAMWSTLADVAASARTRIHVILNPASGPGASPIDPNYVSDGGGAPAGPLLDVRAAGAVIYGYVTTSYAARPAGDVEAEIDAYYDPAFWRGAGVQVDGIFLDEMSSDLANVGYYRELRDHVRQKAAGARVIANPGISATFDSSGGLAGFTVQDYGAAADTLVTHEHTGAEYRTSYVAPAWLDDLTAEHFAHLVHGEASVADMETDVALARARKAGLIYVTDDVLSPNPWDALATYLAPELEAAVPW